MKLERNQLGQARQACVEEERKLARMVAQMERLLQVIRASMERIRREMQRRLAQAKTCMTTAERRYRDAMLKLQRIELDEKAKQARNGPDPTGASGAEGNALAAAKQVEEQRQLVAQYSQEVTWACDSFLQAERAVHETEQRLRQQEEEAKKAVSAAKERQKEALSGLRDLKSVFDKADGLLRDYERGGDD